MAEYHENWLSAARAFAGRLGEEMGIRDVIDEVATLNDDGDSLLSLIRNVPQATVGALWQAKDIPLQTAITSGVEANRFGGARVLAPLRQAAVDMADSGDRWKAARNVLVKGPAWNFIDQPDALREYLTGGATPQEREVAPGIFKSATAGDMLVITNDRMVALGLPDVVRGMLSFGSSIGYELGTMGTEGPFRNGSYVPPSFDFFAPNIGEQVENSDLATAGIYMDLGMEMLLDPLNFAAPAIGRGIANITRMKIGATPGAADLVGVDDLIGAARREGLLRRAAQMLPGRGELNQEALLTAGRSRTMAEWFAGNGDLNAARGLISKYKMATGTAADRLAEMTVAIDDPQQMLHLFNAAAYRNVESINVVRNAVREGTPLARDLDEMLGMTDNMFEQALVDFPINSEIPDGHMLVTSARQFLDDILANNPEVQARWDALADASTKGLSSGQQEALGIFERNYMDRAKAMLTVDEAFAPGQAGQILEALPTNPGRAIRKTEKMWGLGDDVPEAMRGKRSDWLARHTTLAHYVPGGSYRFRPSFVFTAKPGLTFPLHGSDAVERFDDMIEYADNLIGTGAMGGVRVPGTTRTIGNRLPEGYRFAFDQRVSDLRKAFIDAGAIARNPEQIRAEIVNELQSLVLENIAMSKGVEFEAARRLAETGMSKSQTMMRSMIDSQKGYMTMVHENGLATVLVNHPTTVRQTANFIPIMDWAAVRKALSSPVVRAMTTPDGLVSVSDLARPLKDYEGALTGARGLRKFGRTAAGREGAAGLANSAFHAIVDVTDLANSIFKASVLLRLGYPVRNIGEGSLAAAGSGVGWLRVMKEADIPLLLSNHMANVATWPRRRIDRIATWWGYRQNEVMLGEALTRASRDVGMSTDQLKSLIYTVSDDATWNSLLARYLDDALDPAERAAARRTLEELAEMKAELAVHIGEEMADAGLSQQARTAQQLFHADTVGGAPTSGHLFGDSLLADDLEKPISMTPHREVAKAHIDNVYRPAFEMPDGAVVARGQTEQWWVSRAGTTGPVGTPEQIAALQMERGGAGKAARLQVAREAKPGTHIWRGEVVKEGPEGVGSVGLHWTADPNMVMPAPYTHDPLRTIPDPLDPTKKITTGGQKPPGEQHVIWHGVIDGDESLINAYAQPRIDRPLDVEAEVRFARGSKVHILGVSVDGVYHPLDKVVSAAKLDTMPGAGFVKPRAKVQALPAQWARRPFSKSRTAKYTAEKQWQMAQDRLVELRATHSVQMRANPDSPWTTFRRGQYHEGMSEKVEFRIRPKGEGAPKVVAAKTWGKEVDLRSPEGVQAAIDAFPTRVDQQVIDAALAGDRAMVERLSNALADRGIYRMVLPDSADWDGVNIVVHPKGIGGRGLRNAVAKDIDDAVAARVDALGSATVDEAIGRKVAKSDVAMMNRGHILPRLGTPVHPNYHTHLPDILNNGGFRAIMDDAVEQHALLVQRQNALKAAYQHRRAFVQSISKRRGIDPDLYRFTSAYATDGVITDPLLKGFDGYAYRQFASNDMTTAYTFGGSVHRAELSNDLRYSFLQPKVINVDDPLYFEGLSNLLGRYYSDLPGMEDVLRRGGTLTMENIDPVVARALQYGDRQRLYEETVDWAINTRGGREWMRTMGLALDPKYSSVVDPGSTKQALEAAEKAVARRGTPQLPESNIGAARRSITGSRASVSWRQDGHGVIRVSDVDIADLIGAQFNFVDNFMLENPAVRDLFLKGQASADNLKAAFADSPWELKPFHGALSPTSAEYRAMKAAEVSTRNEASVITRKLTDAMGTALRGIGSQPETRLLRHPMFETVGRLDLQQRIRFAEITQGRALSVDEINDLRKLSQQFALRKIKDTLYTLESRSTMDDYLRFVSPFFPAYINAASRWGKFYLRNPAMVGKVMKTPYTAKPLFTDEQGEPVEASDVRGFDAYMILPVGAGSIPMIDKWFPGAKEAMSKTYIPVRSFDWIFQGDPFNPGFGPWVTVPVQSLLTRKDEWYQSDFGKLVADKILPIGPTMSGKGALVDAAMQFMPAAVRRVFDTVSSDQAYLATYNRMYLTLLTKQMEGTYDSKRDIADEAHRLTQLMQSVKFMSSIASPLALQQRGDFEWYSAKYREIVDAVGDQDRADEIFLQMFPNEFLYTQGSTWNLTGGASTATVTDNQGKYGDVERRAAQLGDPNLLWFSDNLQPDGTLDAFSTDDWNPYSRRKQFYSNPEGFADNYRDAKTAEEIARNAFIQKGWTVYGAYEHAVEGMLVQQGYQSGSYELEKAKKEMMTGIGAQLEQQNPLWGAARAEFNTEQKSVNADFFRALINDPEWLAGKDPETFAVIPSIETYLNTRDAIRNIMEAQQEADPKAAGSTQALSNSGLKAMLDATAAQLSADSPTFAQWYDRYFRNDVVTTGDVEMSR